jgi:hypothetical protein
MKGEHCSGMHISYSCVHWFRRRWVKVIELLRENAHPSAFMTFYILKQHIHSLPSTLPYLSMSVDQTDRLLARSSSPLDLFFQYSFKYNQQDASLYNIIYYCKCCTCFRRVFRPSSGAKICSPCLLNYVLDKLYHATVCPSSETAKTRSFEWYFCFRLQIGRYRQQSRLDPLQSCNIGTFQRKLWKRINELPE